MDTFWSELQIKRTEVESHKPMASSFVRKVPLFILGLFAFDLALGLLYLADWGIGHPFLKLTEFVDLDGESNLPTWYSSIQLFLVSQLMGLFAYSQFNTRKRLWWVLPLWSAVFLALSIDEVACIHEWVGNKADILLPGGTRENTIFWETGIWMLVLGVPFFILGVAMIAGIHRYLGGHTQVTKKLLAALIIFVGSAAGIEMLTNFVPLHDKVLGALEVFFEETGEMIGETFFIWAVYELLLAHGISLGILKVNGAVPDAARPT